MANFKNERRPAVVKSGTSERCGMPFWLFFDLGNTLVNEEAAAECRVQRLVEALARYRGGCSFDEVRSAFQEASAEFAPHLSTRAIEKLLADPAGRRAVAAEARYPKELEVLYEGVGE